MNVDIVRIDGRNHNTPPPVNLALIFSLTAEKIPNFY